MRIIVIDFQPHFPLPPSPQQQFLQKLRQWVPVPRLLARGPLSSSSSSASASSSSSGKKKRPKATDFTPPPTWLLQLLALPFAVVNPPQISGLEHVRVVHVCLN